MCASAGPTRTPGRVWGSGSASYLRSGPKTTRKRCRVLGRASWRSAERVEKYCGRSSSAIAGAVMLRFREGATGLSRLASVAPSTAAALSASGAVRFSFWQLCCDDTPSPQAIAADCTANSIVLPPGTTRRNAAAPDMSIPALAPGEVAAGRPQLLPGLRTAHQACVLCAYCICRRQCVDHSGTT